jgi:ABC-type branched-subunit amino acid transport system ATPase component/ABC-type branched-subunit amino acid transport system permease subunit
MRTANTERLTPVGAGRRSWIGQGLLVVLLIIGPTNLAGLTSLVTSLFTFPLTRSVTFTNNDYEVFNLELLLVYLIVVLGLNLVMQAGLLSVGQTAPFAVGAFFVGRTTVNSHWSFYVALIAAGLICALLGVALGIPSLRLGLFVFAMVTLAYAVVAVDLAQNSWFAKYTGGFAGFTGIRMPAPFDSLHSFYWFVALLTALAYILMRNYIRSPFGRASAAVEASQVAAQSVGIGPTASKLRPFALACMLAGIAGGLYGALIGFISPDSFAIDLGLLWVLMVLLGGSGTIAGPIIGTVILFRVPLAAQQVVKSQPGNWSLMIYGIILLLSVHFFPRGIMSGIRRIQERWFAKRRIVAVEKRPEISGTLSPVGLGERTVLEVQGIAKNLSGVQALGGVDLAVTAGTVHALIGPNGSGKTTMLNVISGYLAPDSGTVAVLGEDVTGLSAHVRSRKGLARTFQTPLIFEEITCRDNVLIALDIHRKHNGWSYLVRLPGSRREERRHYERAKELLEAVGLINEFDRPAGELPPGRRRLLELARVLALQPKVVAMDEPAAGLSSSEIDELEEAIRALRAAGIAVLLVEHHVDFILRLADTVTVIDFGKVIARGGPQEVRSDPAVLAAYLGTPIDEPEDEPLAAGAPSVPPS